jgi:citrate lyase subunit beta/citryl-CoA lyase
MVKKTRRSWLLVPLSKPELIAAAAHAGADVIVLDLMEFVVAADRSAARKNFQAALQTVRTGGAEIFAQIDPAAADSDLQACTWPGLTGVVVTRAESSAQILAIAAQLDRLENERGLRAGSLEIVAALETAGGNHAAYEIGGASPRVTGITLGRADLIMDLRPEPSQEIHLMPYLMQRLIIIAGAVGVTPIGAWWRAPDRGLLATPENTGAAADRGRAIGFRGAMCLTAAQVAPLNRAYG